MSKITLVLISVYRDYFENEQIDKIMIWTRDDKKFYFFGSGYIK